MADELKYYKLECRLDHVSNATKCRYYSLYNGARGIWGSSEHAIAEGEAHKALIIALHKPVKYSVSSRYPILPTTDDSPNVIEGITD